MRTIKQTYKYINFALLLVMIFNFGALRQAQGETIRQAQDEIQVSGWIPYWRVIQGTEDAGRHLDVLDTIHPFGYSVKTDGTLMDLAETDKKGTSTAKRTAWQNLFKSARSQDVDVVPTVMWSNGADIDRILGDKTLRKKHIKGIVSMVKREKFDGVNIDYEGKLTSTKESFAKFLKELKKELGKNKVLSCAIEARTPPESLYREVPTELKYSNDLKAIGKYCDRVEVMTYDQGRADLKLNNERAGKPYNPVADKDWVRKVALHMIKDIPKEKLVLGVATYGQEYVVTVAPNWFKEYKKVQSVTPIYVNEIVKAYGVTPSRNKAGELALSYLPHNGTEERNKLIALLPGIAVPKGTENGDMVAEKVLAYANSTGQTITFNYITWSDSEAIKDKVELVKELDLGGIAIFKIDGEEDPKIWEVLK